MVHASHVQGCRDQWYIYIYVYTYVYICRCTRSWQSVLRTREKIMMIAKPKGRSMMISNDEYVYICDMCICQELMIHAIHIQGCWDQCAEYDSLTCACWIYDSVTRRERFTRVTCQNACKVVLRVGHVIASRYNLHASGGFRDHLAQHHSLYVDFDVTCVTLCKVTQETESYETWLIRVRDMTQCKSKAVEMNMHKKIEISQ